MRNAMGTTNKEEPFKREEIIEYADEEYVVLKNYGTRGRVRLLNTHMIIDPFYWNFQGMEARRVKRNVA
jgi:Mn-dependent DtxR family transcriptional regulator